MKNSIDESELFELMEPIYPQWRISNETNSTTSDPIIDPVVATLATIIIAPVIVAAIAPPTLSTFPTPQPGVVAQGGGALPLPAIQVPLIAQQVSLLSQGLSGVTILSVFSSALPGTFFVPRTVDATAILFKESIKLFSAKQYSHPKKKNKSCSKTIIHLGKAKTRLAPALNKLSKVTKPISTLKSKLYQKLGLSCLFPKFFRPYQPVIQRLLCKFGLEEDNNQGFIETGDSDCNSENICRDPSLEDKVITRGHGFSSSYSSGQNPVDTYDDCFPDKERITYGSRVIAKLVNDSSCDDPRYQGICQELSIQNKIVFEDECQSPGCTDPADDIFTPCFGCGNIQKDIFQTNFDHLGNFFPDGYSDHGFSIERQVGESFSATRQSRRLICRRGRQGTARRCRIRIDRLMQIRSRSYRRANEFVQNEEYLSEEDVNIIRRYYYT